MVADWTAAALLRSCILTFIYKHVVLHHYLNQTSLTIILALNTLFISSVTLCTTLLTLTLDRFAKCTNTAVWCIWGEVFYVCVSVCLCLSVCVCVRMCVCVCVFVCVCVHCVYV